MRTTSRRGRQGSRRLGGLPAVLAILILGSAAAGAQGASDPQPAAAPATPRAQPIKPAVSQPQAAPFGSSTPLAQPAWPAPAQPAEPATASEPVVVVPLRSMSGQDAPLGSDLRGKIKEDGEHFREQDAASQREFELSQAEERKAFETKLEDKGFWERRRLKRQFRAAQALRRKEFNAEQAKKRRMYEWRYP